MRLFLSKFLFLLFLTIPTFSQSNYTYQSPPLLNDDIPVASTHDVGLNTQLLEEVVRQIKDQAYVNVDALLIIKNNKLVLEEYFNGYSRDSLHTLKSISKSVTGLLAGIAIDKGKIPSLESKMMDFLPNYQSYRRPEHEQITIHHMLSMTAGIQWQESNVPYGTDANDETMMYRQEDWFPYVLQKPVVEQAGSKFEYNGGIANLLAQVIKNASGISADSFAEKYLFQPLGIRPYYWHKSRHTDYVSAAAGLHLRPRDMAKLGLLYLNKGKWKNKQVISKSFMEKTMRVQIKGQELGPFMVHYGYMGLVAYPLVEMPGLEESYVASGNGGQIIWVMPKLDMAVIITGSNFNNELSQTQPIEMVMKYIYPALKL